MEALDATELERRLSELATRSPDASVYAVDAFGARFVPLPSRVKELFSWSLTADSPIELIAESHRVTGAELFVRSRKSGSAVGVVRLADNASGDVELNLLNGGDVVIGIVADVQEAAPIVDVSQPGPAVVEPSESPAPDAPELDLTDPPPARAGMEWGSTGPGSGGTTTTAASAGAAAGLAAGAAVAGGVSAMQPDEKGGAAAPLLATEASASSTVEGTPLGEAPTTTTTAAPLVLHLDAHGLITNADPTAVRVLGRSREGLIGTRLASLLYPEDADLFASSWSSFVADSGGQRRLRCRYLRSDGSVLWVIQNDKNALDSEHGVVVTELVDVTDEVLAEQLATFESALLEEVDYPDATGLAYLRGDRTVQFANARWSALTGLGDNAPFYEFVASVTDPSSVEAAITRALGYGEPGESVVTVRGVNDVPARRLRMHTRPLVGPGAKPGVVVALDEIPQVRLNSAGETEARRPNPGVTSQPAAAVEAPRVEVPTALDATTAAPPVPSGAVPLAEVPSTAPPSIPAPASPEPAVVEPASPEPAVVSPPAERPTPPAAVVQPAVASAPAPPPPPPPAAAAPPAPPAAPVAPIVVGGAAAGAAVAAAAVTTQMPKVDAPAVDVPDVDLPDVDLPEVEAPKIEAPNVEVPSVETPKISTPDIKPPAIETPQVQAPKLETPKIEAPKLETPDVEAPTLRAPVVPETPAVTEPVKRFDRQATRLAPSSPPPTEAESRWSSWWATDVDAAPTTELDDARSATWKPIWVWMAALVTTAVAAALRLWKLDSIPDGLLPMEEANLVAADRVTDAGVYSLDGLGQPAGPLYVLNGVTSAVSDTLPILESRVTSAIVGCLTVAALFWFARRWFDPLVATTSAGSLALMVWHLHYSRLAVGSIWWPLLLTVAFGLLTPVLKRQAAQPGPTRDLGNPLIWLVAGALLGAGVWVSNVHWLVLFVILVSLFVWFALKARSTGAGGFGRFLALAVGALGVAAPVGLRILRDDAVIDRFDQIDARSGDAWESKGFGGQMAQVGEWWLNTWSELLIDPVANAGDGLGLALPVTYVLGLMAAVGLIVMWWRDRSVLTWMVTAIAIVIPFGPALTTSRALRHGLALSPLLALAAGLGLAWVLRTIHRGFGSAGRVIAGLVALALIGLVGWSSISGYFDVFANDPGLAALVGG